VSATRACIVVIEDDADIARLLELELTDAGYEVHVHPNAVRGLTAVRELDPDLVVLDLGLPDFDGSEIAGRIRRTGSTPILVLTARDAVASKVELFELGVDDYLVKPFHIAELLVRIAALLRRHLLGADAQIGDLRLDPLRRQVWWGEQEVRLSRREFELLALLANQPGRVYGREEIERSLWAGDPAPTSNAVDVHIANLRNKLREVGGFGVIRTVRGVGYALRA
jgi:DNA-binding response OmpR family regulator